MTETKLIKIFISIDDFMKIYSRFISRIKLEEVGVKGTYSGKKVRQPGLSQSEVMTIMIFYQICKFRDFKHYYIHFVLKYLKSYFPQLPSYTRFVELQKRVAIPLMYYARYTCKRSLSTGIQYVDSTILPVCHNRRIHSHKVLKGLAQRGKTSTGWFFGFKLHLIINHIGDILSFFITPGNTDDRNLDIFNNLIKGVWGEVYGDKGYISKKLSDYLKNLGITLLTKSKKNMKPPQLSLFQKIALNQRPIIECTNDSLKNDVYISHTRARAVHAFFANIFAAIAAYQTSLDKKPAANFEFPFLIDDTQLVHALAA